MPDQYKYTKYYDMQFREEKYNCLDNEAVELLFVYQLFVRLLINLLSL